MPCRQALFQIVAFLGGGEKLKRNSIQKSSRIPLPPTLQYPAMQRIPSLFIAPSDLGGRGVFTGEPIGKGSLIEICPVIVLPEKDRPVIHDTALHDYYFLWGNEQLQCAIALGYGSLYNHSTRPNAIYLLDYGHQTIDFYSIKNIEAGAEILVNYNGEPQIKKAVWFENNDS